MNLCALLRIAGLRYRLLWAKVRSRQGRIILFLCGYFLVFPIGMILLAGGVGAGLVAIRSGKAEFVAETVLGVAYLEAILIALVLGFGSSPAFSDAALRRYPLTRLERLGGRQLTALLEPIWLFVLTLDLGVAVGFHVFLGASFLWLAVPAAILLLVTNFLLARVLSVLVEWIAARRAGALGLAIVVFLVIAVLPSVPALVHSAVWWNQDFRPILLAILKFTPPYAAAGIMVGTSVLASFSRLLGLLLWCFVLAGLLALMERLPAVSRGVAGVRTAWIGPCDRIAGLFGPSAPLVSKTLRYYLRCSRVRLAYVLVLPVLFSVLWRHGHRHPAEGLFLALGILPIVGWSGTMNMSVNAFGFDGSGFRRYFLAPASPKAVLRVASLVPLCLSALLVSIALLSCRFFLFIPVNSIIVTMLVSSAVCGLFFFHGLAIWTSLLAPSKADFAAVYAKDTSSVARVVSIVGILVPFFLSIVLYHLLGAPTLLRYWWVLPLMMAAVVCFYFVTLRLGARVLCARRERILSMVERGY